MFGVVLGDIIIHHKNLLNRQNLNLVFSNRAFIQWAKRGLENSVNPPNICSKAERRKTSFRFTDRNFRIRSLKRVLELSGNQIF